MIGNLQNIIIKRITLTNYNNIGYINTSFIYNTALIATNQNKIIFKKNIHYIKENYYGTSIA